MRIFFRTQVVGKIEKTRVTFKNVFSESIVVYEIMWKKYGTTRDATGYSKMRHILFKLMVPCIIIQC